MLAGTKGSFFLNDIFGIIQKSITKLLFELKLMLKSKVGWQPKKVIGLYKFMYTDELMALLSLCLAITQHITVNKGYLNALF